MPPRPQGGPAEVDTHLDAAGGHTGSRYFADKDQVSEVLLHALRDANLRTQAIHDHLSVP
jgi:hypothetical protein